MEITQNVAVVLAIILSMIATISMIGEVLQTSVLSQSTRKAERSLRNLARTNYERSLTNLALLQSSLQVITNYERSLTNIDLAQGWRPVNQTLQSNLTRSLTNLALLQSWWWGDTSANTNDKPILAISSVHGRDFMDWFHSGTLLLLPIALCLIAGNFYRDSRREKKLRRLMLIE
jgi:hypothetical protein